MERWRTLTAYAVVVYVDNLLIAHSNFIPEIVVPCFVSAW